MLKNPFKRSNKNTGNESTSSTDQTDDRTLFWSKFQEYSNQNTPLENFESNQKRDDYYGFILKSFKEKDAHLTAWKGYRKGLTGEFVGAFVVLQDTSDYLNASKIFNKLKEYTEIIETTLGVEDELQWVYETEFRTRGPMIGFYKSHTTDEDDIKWISERLETLNISFFMTIQIFNKLCAESLNPRNE